MKFPKKIKVALNKLKYVTKNLHEILRHSARIACIKNQDGKKYFIIQLIGKSICSRKITALELLENPTLLHAIRPNEREFVKYISQLEYNAILENSQTNLLVSAIDFDNRCIISITSFNGLFQAKLTPHEVILNKKIFNNLNASDQKQVEFYAGITFSDTMPNYQNTYNSKILKFPTKL